MTAKYDFTGCKALVTGASRGIGYAIAEALSKAGANVVALARDKARLEELRSKHSNISIVVGDVTSPESALAALLAPYQPFDILVNNAGVAALESSHKLSEEAVTQQLDVNLKAPIIITKIVTSEMIRNSVKGTVVSISSQASLRPIENHTAYCASKAGLDMAMKCFAKELGKFGIRVNCVNPTVVMTDMGKQNWSDPNKAGPLLEQIPLGRFAEVDEVVKAVLFLLSDSSAMTTGLCFPVDGGFSQM
ncbi:oxidoreductase, short chain dehydrogenase/reductase family protein [Oesophagostomum dentatum]|uniref:Oxidoreductase, short chain dehydrogenase/reductase family protein n=1 Tax=Oesophagostomum dentatum TaxID=61180 RepID=A0A0B1TR37_OESDE|nr:oxidoreductase, short chain dehydrogenase/reductase family protein [Oesophagostomum dentatum]